MISIQINRERIPFLISSDETIVHVSEKNIGLKLQQYTIKEK
jgi:hypothetical protein